MLPRKYRKEEIIPLVNEPQEALEPTDEVQVREHDQDEYYESPVDFEGFYANRMELRG